MATIIEAAEQKKEFTQNLVGLDNKNVLALLNPSLISIAVEKRNPIHRQRKRQIFQMIKNSLKTNE